METAAKRVAYIMAQTVCAMAEIEAMKAANHERLANGYALAYDEEAFMAVPNRNFITHNQVIEYLRDVS